jgi:hypothetical protein
MSGWIDSSKRPWDPAADRLGTAMTTMAHAFRAAIVRLVEREMLGQSAPWVLDLARRLTGMTR